MRHDIVGERATFEKGYCYQEGIAVRQIVFPDGQVEVSAFPATDWSRCNQIRLLPRPKRGESDKRERNNEVAARRARQELRKRSKSIQANHMVTLTTKKNITDLDEFHALFKQWRRIMSKHAAFHYVAVPERQTRGAWHLHVAMHGRPARQLAIRAWMKVCGGKGKGYCHIRPPKGAGKFGKPWRQHELAGYISKYIGKDVGVSELNRKRYWSSRGIVVPVRQTFGVWMGYPSMYDALQPVLRDLERDFGTEDLVAYVSAKNGSFWLATGPRPGHFFGPPSPFVTEYDRVMGALA